MKIYNYLYRNRERAIFVLTIFLTLVVCFLYEFRVVVFKNENTYFYYFSTIVQGFLALVAFLGAMVVYKLQIIESNLNNFNEKLVPHFEYFLGQEARSLTVEESIEESRRLIKNTKEISANKFTLSMINKYLDKMVKLLEEKREIRSRLVDFSVISFINIGLALVFLPTSVLISKGGLFVWGFGCVVLNGAISLWSIFLAFGVIRKVMGYDFVMKAGTGRFKIRFR